ncbi:hypothetical protein LIN78_07310 [Leeia sp. TBRC 13508]|uniref:Uncharacterized protein n=1 Tax=Leeia speluncae TaxID=2884804 RepID=A0ABS8D595_9NEIS|nr:hypothetical protein [Leeia speluncae]MCB6183351.1 hypothetical protein [Leeia speluncae]
MPLSHRQQLINTFLSLEFSADEAALLADAELKKQTRKRKPLQRMSSQLNSDRTLSKRGVTLR